MKDKNYNDDGKWKILDSRYLSRRPWLTVRREILETPQGKKIPEYYVLEYPDWVNVIARTKDGEFIFVRQYRHGLGVTEYELCAGVCEKSDKSPLDAAKRELAEETGFGGGQWRLLMTTCANPSTQNNVTHCFLAEGVEPEYERNLDPTEELSVHKLSLKQVIKLLKENKIMQATHTSPLWKYMAEEKLLLSWFNVNTA